MTSYEYEGKLVHATDPFNKVTTTERDALGRLVTVTDAESGMAPSAPSGRSPIRGRP
jgi:YD repeat-containing protein